LHISFVDAFRNFSGKFKEIFKNNKDIKIIMIKGLEKNKCVFLDEILNRKKLLSDKEASRLIEATNNLRKGKGFRT